MRQEKQDLVDDIKSDAALQSCNRAYTQAVQCCTNPATCVSNYDVTISGTDPEQPSIQHSCDENHQLANRAATANNDAATACIQTYTACTNACETVSTTKTDRCADLAKLADRYSELAQSTYAAAAQGLDCQSLSAAVGNGLAGSSSASRFIRMGTSVRDVTCASAPDQSGCSNTRDAASVGVMREGTLSGNVIRGTDFVVSESTDRPNFVNQETSGAAPLAVGPIPNGGGSGVTGAAPRTDGIEGGNGAGGLFGASTKPIGDIDEGLRSGGFTRPSDDGLEELALANKRELAAIRRARPKWWDLRQYLPGYEAEAVRLLELARRLEAMGIHPANVNLWSRINAKFAEKCHGGELLDCR